MPKPHHWSVRPLLEMSVCLSICVFQPKKRALRSAKIILKARNLCFYLYMLLVIQCGANSVFAVGYKRLTDETAR